jgi:hypothetical protein
MDKVKDYFQCVDNPEHVRKEDKELYDELEPIICELLDELKAKGRINLFTPLERKRLQNVMDNVYQLEINNNWFVELLFSQDNRKKNFLSFSSQFDLDETKFIYLYVQSCVLLGISHTELFKTFLLFHLKGSYKASDFYRTMEKFAPNAWKKLAPYVDSSLRNALAHGTWIIENDKVVLFKNSELIACEYIELKKFFFVVRKLNILYVILFEVIKKKRKEGFFELSINKQK